MQTYGYIQGQDLGFSEENKQKNPSKFHPIFLIRLLLLRMNRLKKNHNHRMDIFSS